MSNKAIEWDQTKALANVRKHGVSFEEAALALADDAAYYKRDDLHSDEEDRFIIVCSSSFDRVLTISYTLRDETVRIISARRATFRERQAYEEKNRS
jgi:uncharacterized DUF497 family protein